MCSLTFLLAALTASLYVTATAGAQEDCVLDAMWVQAAAAAHRTNPRLHPYEEVERLLLLERTRTRQPVSKLEVLKSLVEYAWTHHVHDPNPVLRDFDVSMQFKKDCEQGGAP